MDSPEQSSETTTSQEASTSDLERASAALADGTPDTKSAGTGASRRSSWKAQLLLMLLICAGGVATGLGVGPIVWPVPTPPEKEEPTSTHTQKKVIPTLSADDLSRLDEVILSGQYASALQNTNSLVQSGLGHLLPLRYRIALCLEGLGRAADALPHYRACLSDSDPLMVLASQFGLARACILSGQDEEARALLCTLLLRAGDPIAQSQPYDADVAWLLAMLLTFEFQDKQLPGVTRPHVMVGVTLSWTPEQYLPYVYPPKPIGKTAAVKGEKSDKAKKSEKSEKSEKGEKAEKVNKSQSQNPAPVVSEVMAPGLRLTRLARASWLAEEHRLEARFPSVKLVHLVEQLARSLYLELSWGPGARELLDGRNAEVTLTDCSVAELLTWLTIPHGLTWEFLGAKDSPAASPASASTKKGTPNEVVRTPIRRLVIQHQGSLAEERRQKSVGVQARRALMSAVDRVAQHPRAELIADMFHGLGCVTAKLGNRKEAISWYDRLLKERPRSQAVIPGGYNLGLLRLSSGDAGRAREAFFRSIDQQPGNNLAPFCEWWVARSYLDTGDGEGALRPLSRASGRAEVGPAAAVALSAAQLMRGDLPATLAALRRQRQTLQKAPYRDVAAFLDAYARYQGAGNDPRERRAILTELVNALVKEPTAPWLGPIFPYLMGQAYRHIGLADEMVALYDQTAPTAPGFLADQMRGEAAEALLAKAGGKEDLVGVRKRFLTLTEVGLEPWTTRSRIRLAELDLRSGNVEGCLMSCRALLQHQQANRTVVLALMARAYTYRGDHSRAARCLAGEIPTDE